MCDRSTSRRSFFPPLEGYPTQNTLAKLTDVRIGYPYQASDGTLATAHKLQDFRNQEMSSPTAWMGREMLGDRVVGKLDCGSGKTARAVVDDCPSASSLPAASLPPAISKLHCHSLLGSFTTWYAATGSTHFHSDRQEQAMGLAIGGCWATHLQLSGFGFV